MSSSAKSDWLQEYPFPNCWMKTADGYKLHYVDVGQGFPVVMAHGNPTWSFMYRALLKQLPSIGHRAIALDHLGCGLSDKPQDWSYHLADHIENFRQLVEKQLRLKQFDLIVHDWGGAIGLGYAVMHPERIRRIVLMNTAAYCSEEMPWRIAFIRNPVTGPLMIRGLNMFAGCATHMAVVKKMSPTAKAGMLAPYDNWHNRVAIYKFVRDIPMSPKHPSWQTLKDIENNLQRLADKKILICWGEKDFCFNMRYFETWKLIYPNALALSFPNAGHYLLEDLPNEIIPLICKFLDQPCLSSQPKS